VEHAEQTLQQASDKLPQLEQAWRTAQDSSTESRGKIMQAQQQIELESAHQRNASNILNGLTVRRERLAQEKSGLQMPDSAHLSELKMQLEENQAALEEAGQQLEIAQQRQPALEQERHDAQEQVNLETAANVQLEARLQALRQLQESVQNQGKVQPWLDKHELGALPRLWQKMQIEQGWETALESILRERTSALELSNLDWAKAFFNDAPPAKLALFSPNIVAAQTSVDVPAGFKPLLDLLKLNDPGLRALLQDWLHGVFVADDAATAVSERNNLPPGACFVTRQGHVIGRAGVRFYAADSEQDGMLARQQQIENLGKQLRAQQLLAEQARSDAVRADAALSQAARHLQECRQNVGSLTQAVHSLQIEVVKLSEVQERFNQRSSQIAGDLAEIAEQEAEQQQIRVESEARFEELDAALAELQGAHEDGQTVYLEKDLQLTDARQRLRELERAAQDAVFAEKSQRSKMDELKRNIATALEQSSQLTVTMQQGTLELENLNDQTADAGLQSLLEKRSAQEHALSDARHELDQITQKLRHLEDARAQTERNLQPQRDKIMELQLKEQAARLNQEQFSEQLREAEADEAALSAKLQPDLRPSYLQGEVTRLGNAIAALGAVNLAALD
ncbi:MAG: chromosome segregation protein SMC, partial [Oxalobacteraceae bacterium]